MKLVVAAAASTVLASCSAFMPGQVPVAHSRTKTRATVVMTAWPGDRRPNTNPERLDCRMGASYDRESIRNKDYMDFDLQNPPAETEWWAAYLPSEEEQEAAAAGFDFSDPDGWLEAQKAGTLKVDAKEPTEFVAIEGFTAASREWPELKKTVVVK